MIKNQIHIALVELARLYLDEGGNPTRIVYIEMEASNFCVLVADRHHSDLIACVDTTINVTEHAKLVDINIRPAPNMSVYQMSLNGVVLGMFDGISRAYDILTKAESRDRIKGWQKLSALQNSEQKEKEEFWAGNSKK